MTKFSAQQQSQLAQIGVFLRENRENQGKSLEDIAIRTYIRPQLLNGIELGDPDLLPEPIFVQGFIRRYAENLGLDGKELSTQFSVDSIPSTPRPVRQAEPEDSPTTRLTRASTDMSAAKAASTDSSAVSASMFSAGSVDPLEDSLVSAQETASDRSSFAAEAPPVVDNAVLTMPSETLPEGTAADPTDSPFETSTFSFSQPDFLESDFSEPDFSGSDFSEPDFLEPAVKENSGSGLQRPVDEASANHAEAASPDRFVGLGADTKLPTIDSPTADLPTSEDNFASEAAEFDRQNLTPAIEPEFAVEPAAVLVSNNRFDDDLPAELTIASDASEPPVYADPDPVEDQYNRPEGPNLKPFVIGGFVAVLLTAAVVALSSLFGGDRTPAVANNPALIEQTGGDLKAAGKETLPPTSTKTASSPASTAPVYVEAKATAEAWVSVIADGTTLFEGTLQPGDTAVWEAQENINVYSGDAGALELAQNGKPAAVMGERGQPEEKDFTLN